MYCVNDKEYNCSVSVTLDIFNDRWKLAILWHLLNQNKRYKELHEEINQITQKTLTVKLCINGELTIRKSTEKLLMMSHVN